MWPYCTTLEANQLVDGAIKHFLLFVFRRVLKIAKKLLLASSCLSVHPQSTTELPLGRFS
jgi:hypothetical protein